MALTAETLKDKLTKELSAEFVDVKDISPDMCGTSFHAVVVSPQFVGKARLQQQRMVNSALAEEMSSIHAFTQKTYTPEAWKKANCTN
ncbi:bolA-like protein 2 [Ciona intestinalis]